MIQCKAYIYRLKTKPAHRLLMGQFAGCCRFVWNKALALQKERLDAGDRVIGYNSLALLLPSWKKEHPFLADAPSQALQQVLKNLDRAIKDAFDKKQPDKRFPVFKKKGLARDSLRYPQGFKTEGNRVFLPKIGWVPFRKRRPIEGTPKERNCGPYRKLLVCLHPDGAGGFRTGPPIGLHGGCRPGREEIHHRV